MLWGEQWRLILKWQGSSSYATISAGQILPESSFISVFGLNLLNICMYMLCIGS